VATREIGGAQHWRSRAYIEPLHQQLAMAQQDLLDQQPPPRIAAIALVAEYCRLVGDKGGYEARPLTVFRYVGDADRPHLGRAARYLWRDHPAIGGEAPGRWRPDAGEQFEQFALAVAADPGDCNDFAGADIKAHIVD